MRNFQRTLLIGATGKLGTHLAKTYNPRIAHTRFEDPAIFWNHYQDIDTVWLVARACRKTAPRRDRETKRTEIQGVRNIVDAFRDKHILARSFWARVPYPTLVQSVWASASGNATPQVANAA